MQNKTNPKMRGEAIPLNPFRRQYNPKRTQPGESEMISEENWFRAGHVRERVEVPNPAPKRDVDPSDEGGTGR